MLFQAEGAELTGAVVSSVNAGSVGDYVDVVDETGAVVEWTIPSGAGADVLLDFRYALGLAAPRTMRLEVNGVDLGDVTFETTQFWTNWTLKSLRVPLEAGDNVVRLVSTGDSGPDLDSLRVTPFLAYQAEDAVIEGAVIAGNRDGAEDGAFVDFGEAGESVGWTVDAPRDGQAPVEIRYSLRPNNAKLMALEVNGVVMEDALSFASTGSWSTWSTLTLDIDLAAGANLIRLVALDGNGPNIDRLTTIGAPRPDALDGQIILQAEDAVLSGATIATNRDGAEGGAFADFDNAFDSATFTIEADGAGTAPLEWRYALRPSQAKLMALEVNGEVVDTALSFASTGSWSTWSTVTLDVELAAGANVIRLIAVSSNGPNIDRLTVGDGDGGSAQEPPGPLDMAVTLQAEDAVLLGATIATNRDGAEGDAFADFDNAGDSATFTIDADGAGTAPLELRYALRPSKAKLMAIEVNGEVVEAALSFSSTGSWSTWSTVTLDIALATGANTIRLIAVDGNGPNIDRLTVGAGDGAAEGPTDALDMSITLQAEDAAYSGAIADSTHAGAEGGVYVDYQNPAGDMIAWTVTADRDGDAALDFRYALNANAPRVMSLEINGVIVDDAVSFAATGNWSLWSTLSVDVDLIAGINTIRLIATGDSGPNIDSLTIVGTAAGGPQWGEFTDSIDALLPGETGLPLDSAFAVGIDIDSAGQGIDIATVNTETVQLIKVSNGQPVPIIVNSTGGADSISISPEAPLQPNTNHRIVIDGVLAQNGETYPSVTRDFRTGSQSLTEPLEGVDFEEIVVSGEDPVSSLAFSDDFASLYATTVIGSVIRWDVDPDGALSNRAEFVVEPGRSLIGLAVDPNDPDRIWLSNNEGFSDSAPEIYGSKISYIDITDSAAFTGTVTDYVTGLPRSAHDHLTNSVVFGPDGALYFTQGGMTAMGAPDAAWGIRDETLLSAALLRLDTTLEAPTGGFDVSTGGTALYDPAAPDAPLTIYATGLRNTYDLLFHSGGSLYAPGNGSAAGGNSPDDPSTPEDETIIKGDTEQDYLFRVDEGGYYGHPNPSRGEYIRNGGNPTDGIDPAEVLDYAVGIAPDPNYRGFVHDFGASRSANGIAEYAGGAFGGLLDGALLVAEYSTGDRIVGVEVDAAGDVTDSFVLATGFNNPLDLAVHQPSGNIYLAAFGAGSSITDDEIILLKPSAPATLALSEPGGELSALETAVTADGGTTAGTFEGDAGGYDIAVTVFDSFGGLATVEVLVNDQIVETFRLDTLLDTEAPRAGDLVTLTLRNIALESGDRVEVFGVADDGSPVTVETLTVAPAETSTMLAETELLTEDILLLEAQLVEMSSYETPETSGDLDPQPELTFDSGLASDDPLAIV